MNALRRPTLIALAAAVLTPVLSPMRCAADDAARPDPITMLSDYRLNELADRLTFYISFDRDSMLPDMAAGKHYKPTVSGPYDRPKDAPSFAPGLSGKALVLGSGRGLYPHQGNVTFDTNGAVAFWVRPQGWTRPNGSNIVFISTEGNNFHLQRQGPKVDDNGKSLRNEHIQFLARSSRKQPRFTSASYGALENDRWYFFVANWNWPTIQLSINGEGFKVRPLKDKPEPGFIGDFAIGSPAGEGGLIDEVMFFDRPLTLEEVRRIYEVGLKHLRQR